ncbi:MAG: TRAP transporter small permease subunit [Gammaproteobacteria bacterium]
MRFSAIRKIAAKFCAFCDRASLVISHITMWLTAVIVATMMCEVVLRYVFNSPTLWANELSLWLAGILYLFAGLYAMREHAHIRVTVVYDSLPRKVQRVLDVIGTLVVVAFAIALVAGAWTAVYNTVARWETSGTKWDPPIPSTVKPLILIVTALIAVQAVSNLIADFNKDKPGPPEDNGEDDGHHGAD